MRMLAWSLFVGAICLAVLLFTKPAAAAGELDCRPGARHILQGKAEPSTSLLLLFAGDAVGGGTSDASGAYRLRLVVGNEAPGIYPVEVVTRAGRRLVARVTCIVPGVNETPLPRATQPAASATTSVPTASTTLAAATATLATATATTNTAPSATLQPGVTPSITLTPSPSATSQAGSTPGTATATLGTATATLGTATATRSATSSTRQPLLTLDDVEEGPVVGDELEVIGDFVDAQDEGIKGALVTVRFSYDGQDRGLWCSATTDEDGFWECNPQKTVGRELVGKRVTLTANVSYQTRNYTDSSEFIAEAEES